MTHHKFEDAVVRALNGEADDIEPPTRRALMAIAAEADEHANTTRNNHLEVLKQLKYLRGLLVSATVSLLIIVGNALFSAID